MDSLPGYVAVLDTAYTVVAANRAWTDLHAARGAECIACVGVGDNLMAGILGSLSDHEESARIAALLEGAREAAASTGTITVRTPDDRRMTLHARRVAGQGAVVLAAVDVSEWAESERALRQAQRDLIDAAQLAAAGELVGGIAHDLRQPLAAIEMNVAVASHHLNQDPPQHTSALVALDDAMQGTNLLRESVQVLQNLVAKREPAFDSVSIAELVDEAIRLVHAEAVARGIAIERLVATPERLPRLQADAGMLREAILSLLLDAVENADATAADARVLVSARPLEGDVELVVHHRGRNAPSQTSGWARSVARYVAEAHGASMSVDVDVLFGTTVRTTWPTVRVSPGTME